MAPDDVFCVKKRTDGGYDIFAIEDNPDKATNRYKLVIENSQLPPQDLDESLVMSKDSIPDYLLNSPTRRVHIVVSTNSGTGLAENFHSHVLAPVLSQLGINNFATFITQDAQSIARFAADQLEGSLEHTVILLSGDGGVVEMLNGKATSGTGRDETRPQPTVAILPLGTGNALFNSLHKHVPQSCSSPMVQALRTLLGRGSQAAPLPCFRADFSSGSRIITYKNPDDSTSGDGLREQEVHVSRFYGAIVASYGFHSQLVWESDTPEYRKHGDKRFGMVAQELLKEAHGYRAGLEMETAVGDTAAGKLSKLGGDRHGYILATMVSNLEKTFTISPASRPLDGTLRLVHFGPASGKKIMDIMMAAYNDGAHVDMAWEKGDGEQESGHVSYEPVVEIRATTQEEDARWRKVCIDGTIVEIPMGGSMAIRVEDTTHLRVLVASSVAEGSS